jgi:hypothetical protein
MKKILTALTLTSMVALGGCAGLTQANLAAQVSAVEAEVQADANLVCGFIPTAATIAAFIPGAGAIAPAAASIAEAICSAIAQAPPVTTQSARLKSLNSGVAVNVATVRNLHGDLVPISGTFTH